MTKIKILALGLFGAWLLSVSQGVVSAPLEWNPVRTHPAQLGLEANRVIVGFKATPANSITKTINRSGRGEVRVRQALTSTADVMTLIQRRGVTLSGSRQLTPNMHVLFLSSTLYGADLEAALARLRSDAAVAFADIDQLRYPHEIPNDPLFQPVTGSSSGQWYMLTPPSAGQSGDAAAIDAVSAWNVTTGSNGIVIADVDSGVRFEHPDLLRAGFGGRLLPGYDFVGEDYDVNTGRALGTYLVANDGDGWDPDPSDPGDWINAADQANTHLFPSSRCPIADSTWHGTRVVGVLGAITNNATGIAGMTWSPFILPVRALGKCDGYDSDIMTGMQWAAGLSVSGVPDNPYPANIINLSLGGSSDCLSDYQAVINTLNSMGVLIVASAGNASGPVESPANCQGVLAVAGLRNVGTKVGYSSFGAEVGISAPAGNCVNSSGPCLRSVDTTTNTGLTTPADSTYTNETNPNLGTSFSAPIVSGIAALMRAVNGNLSPAQLIARIKASAAPFPANTSGLPVCPATDSSSGQCACVPGQCGAGMANAYQAVQAAQNPIAAISVPLSLSPGSAAFDGSGSVAACNQSIVSYAWSASGGVTLESAAGGPGAQVTWNGSVGTLQLTVTDSSGYSDTAIVDFTASGASTSAPTAAGNSASACPAPITFTANPPTVAPVFSPFSVAAGASATLTLTLINTNPFALTQSTLAETLPANLSVATNTTPTTTCSGAARSLTSTGSGVTLANAIIPASGSCTVSLRVSSASAGAYALQVPAQALMTGPAGGNSATPPATLTVTAPAAAGSGGGAVTWFDALFSAALLFWGRIRVRGRA